MSKELLAEKVTLMNSLKLMFTKLMGEETAEEKEARLKLEADAKKLKFAEAKLKDGTMISYEGDTPATGQNVYVVDATGAEVPAPDGQHELEDGTIISTEKGVIIDVKAAEATSEDEPSKLSKLEAQIAKLEIAKEIARHKDEIANLKQKQTELSAMQAELKTAKETMAAMFALVEKIADLPSEDSKTDPKKDKFKKQPTKSDINEYMKQVRAGFSNEKK